MLAEPAYTKEQALTLSTTDNNGLERADVDRIEAAVQDSRSPATRRAYAGAWGRFEKWAAARGVPSLPADPAHVAAFLAARAADGAKPPTVRQDAAAISGAHRAAGMASPAGHEGVRRVLAGLARADARPQGQAAPLTADVLAAIRATCNRPRSRRDGRLESAARAERRDRVDLALVATMRDGLLRRSEAAALRWDDVAFEADGSARLQVRRSKTDQESTGAVLYLGGAAAAALAAIRPARAPVGAVVFGLGPGQIGRRVRAAAEAAGLDGDFSGHSPRVGMAQDLAAAGAELPALMTAGRWASPSMPARYTRGQEAGRGAVATYYADRG